MRSGNHRLRFSADGRQLYVGQTVRGWGVPAEGIQRITSLGGVPEDIETMKITSKGFIINFTREIPDEFADKTVWKFASFTLQPRWQYGGEPENQREHGIQELKKTGPKTIEVALEDFSAGRVYRLDLENVKYAGGKKRTELQNKLFFYTANELPR
jgi:hypothetical protein